MERPVNIRREAYFLRRRIADLEWHIPQIISEDVRERKIDSLKMCREKLKRLEGRMKIAL